MNGACTIRPERAGDADAVSAVNTAAFGRADEARLVERRRERAGSYLGLVAVAAGQIVGHLLVAPVSLHDHAGPLRLRPGRARSA